MLDVGNILEGRVTGIKPFGAFVALPEGKVGMVHISEVSNAYVQDIAAVLHEGETVKVKVIGISPEGKIALSIKQLLPRPERPARDSGRGNAREGRGNGPRGGRRPPRDDGPRVWQPKPPARSDNLSFEDMMSRFKSQSESKLADLDHESGGRRGGSAARGRRGGR